MLVKAPMFTLSPVPQNTENIEFCYHLPFSTKCRFQNVYRMFIHISLNFNHFTFQNKSDISPYFENFQGFWFAENVPGTINVIGCPFLRLCIYFRKKNWYVIHGCLNWINDCIILWDMLRNFFNVLYVSQLMAKAGIIISCKCPSFHHKNQHSSILKWAISKIVSKGCFTTCRHRNQSI